MALLDASAFSFDRDATAMHLALLASDIATQTFRAMSAQPSTPQDVCMVIAKIAKGKLSAKAKAAVVPCAKLSLKQEEYAGHELS